MSEAIVEKLRQYAGETYAAGSLISQAADEIERLRAIVAQMPEEVVNNYCEAAKEKEECAGPA